jgi:hypothetical protein
MHAALIWDYGLILSWCHEFWLVGKSAALFTALNAYVKIKMVYYNGRSELVIDSSETTRYHDPENKNLPA